LEYIIDEENGIILDKITRDRCLILTKARMTQILSRFTQIFQSSAQVVITEAFKSAGERYVTEVVEEKKANTVQFLRTAALRFTNAGLGRIEIVQFNEEKGEFNFRIHNNFFSEITNEDATYCNCVEAFVAGMYKAFFNKTPNIQETKCKGKKDPYCEWQLTP
jgi:predicted hydrocarbon binding protein